MFHTYLRNKFFDYVMYFPFILPTTTYIGFMNGVNKTKNISNDKNSSNIKYILKNTSCGLAIGILYPIGIPIFSYYYLKGNFIKNEINHKINNN